MQAREKVICYICDKNLGYLMDFKSNHEMRNKCVNQLVKEVVEAVGQLINEQETHIIVRDLVCVTVDNISDTKFIERCIDKFAIFLSLNRRQRVLKYVE